MVANSTSLRVLRAWEDITQGELAALAGVSASQIGGIERRGSIPGRDLGFFLEDWSKQVVEQHGLGEHMILDPRNWSAQSEERVA